MTLKMKSPTRPGRSPGVETGKIIEAFAESLSKMDAERHEARPYEYLPLREVCRRTTLSKTQLYRMVADGKFPRPVPISEGRKAWVDKEVHTWMDEKRKGRESGP